MASDAHPSLRDPRTHIRAVGGAFVVVVLALMVARVAISLGTPLIAAIGLAQEGALWLTLRSAFQFIGFGVAGISYLFITNRMDFVPIRWPTRADLKWIGGGLLGLIGMYVAITAIFGALGISGAESVIVTQGSDQPIYFLYLIPLSILLVGPTEELIFRGLVQGLFREAYGWRVAIVVASAVFAVPHYGSYIGEDLFATLATLSVVLILGGVLGLVYEKSRNLLVPAVVHGLFNTIQFIIAYVTTTGIVGS
jgi:hypothetical protein